MMDIGAFLIDTIFLGPTCSDFHIPGYVMHPKIKDAGSVFVVTVNDAFVYVLSAPSYL
jgi:peroxiredoxin